MPEPTESTPFYLSKTLWVNVLALIAMILQGVTGNVLLNMELQATILAIINMVLRFVTKKPVVWS